MPGDSITLQNQYARLGAKLAPQLSGLQPLRAAFLADSTLDHWVGCLRWWLLLEGFALDAYIAPIGTWRQEVADAESHLYRHEPDIVWFFLRRGESGLDLGNSDTADAALDHVSAKVERVSARCPALLVVNNLVPPAHRLYGNQETQHEGSVSAEVQRFNSALRHRLPGGACLFDINHQAARYGLDRWEDARLWHISKHPFELDAHGPVAFAAARLLAAARGRARKCLVLDLDNTLWGGVVGDDGLEGIRVGPDAGGVGEAYAGFQAWLKALSARGIALAVCSKNNDALAREPFLKKRGMVLQLSDFVAFRANWLNKADNILSIAQELNLGLDSIVFVDDNPAECALVRSQLPEIGVVELPTDPSDYIAVLSSRAWFETLGVTAEDTARVQAYRDSGERARAKLEAGDLDNYLRGLKMRSRWDAVHAGTLTRAAQLVNKTNQFQLTGTRYGEARLQQLAASDAAWVGTFTLADRFGEHGIIAVAVLTFAEHVATIDTWVMSCRVFARQMEHFTFNVLCSVATDKGCTRLRGRYIATSKNAVVADLFKDFGGQLVAGENGDGTDWVFELGDNRPPLPHFIEDVSPLPGRH
jgi:FkbH-like protein